MIRRPPRSTLDRSSAASDVYKRQAVGVAVGVAVGGGLEATVGDAVGDADGVKTGVTLSLIHISEPTRPY